ncbi:MULTISPECIES: ATP-dependent DNA helicase [unclassified Polaromonas]|uniref:ATP-dependent DNA helicase n=1 Tax=unclassified Polaromonas TaxID=2638319 RepID=UPI000F095CF9|nr:MULTISPECIES: ATP-dependent DNA helicase [unclassified Polaromonas]AYQ26858.1 ATP-dependent DNA helicase [Polaromonas sp. SP1]QGJ18296.1 ATP-dependent DNA helicase [Polaromonas sp. Pch-P]
MQYVVAVRALCEFTAKHGDLDLRFTPSPSAQEGMAGHALVASRRGGAYQSEVSLEGEYKALRVRGRADGYDPDANQLEEVKTYRGDLHSMADNRRHLHWAQLKIYGCLLCAEKGLSDINLTLVYFDVASLQETPLTEHFTAASLKEYFEAQCERFLAWATQELAHRQARDAALGTLAFPHATFRPGQRELAEAVYKTAQAGACLMAQAPTGIGKTIGTVFPLLKAVPKKQLDKLFFLAAKTPGRRLALDAMARIKGAGPLPLRVLELVARDKACEHPGKACHGDACPLAKGFYDRLPQARSAAVAHAAAEGPLDKAALRELALAHHVCPYYLSQELVTWSDVVVGDYNYYFDTSALLHGQASGNQWRVGVLVDEAHNLVERARKMYSATLSQAQLQQVHATAPRAVRGALERLNRGLLELQQAQQAEGQAYQVHPELPVTFLKTLGQALSQITDFLLANPTRMDGELQDFYFEALHFSRMAEDFGEHSLFDVTLQEEAGRDALGQVLGQQLAVLNIRNVVPAPFLAPRFAAAQSTALFSATLSPQNYYADTLGLPAGTVWTEVQSPFLAEQLQVSVVSDVSTRFQHRDDSLSPIVDLMARQYESLPGNYLAFLSSYDYLQKLATLFRQRYPHIPMWEQTRGMEETARDAFLARFTLESRGIGFAVLGGSFAEGIDLPGDRLIGAFIATLGLPQVNPVNEQIRERMGVNFGAGQSYDYTYLYPGLQKVVQAAGRVIRTTSDRGVVYLIDDRFTRPEIQGLLPGWWKVTRLRARRKEPAPA